MSRVILGQANCLAEPLLPISAKALVLPAWRSGVNGLYEDVLTSSHMPDAEESYEEEAAGEDGLGEVPQGAGWDEAADIAEEENDGLAEDDIEGWD